MCVCVCVCVCEEGGIDSTLPDGQLQRGCRTKSGTTAPTRSAVLSLVVSTHGVPCTGHWRYRVLSFCRTPSNLLSDFPPRAERDGLSAVAKPACPITLYQGHAGMRRVARDFRASLQAAPLRDLRRDILRRLRTEA